jgi:pimeloyl-ACP methyl ester carboxylesterase
MRHKRCYKVLDAQWDFPLVYSILGQQYYDGFVPGLILVGITWGGESPNPDVLRLRDFTPTDASGDGTSGGAERFLSFIERELIPFVDRHYRTSAELTLIGSSLGGLFTLYTLFKRPDLFSNFIATSPATPWDNEALFAFEDGFAERSARHPSRLFLAVAELEDLYQPVRRLAERLGARAYPGLTWSSHVVAGAGHSGVKAEGNSRGLQFAFERPDLALTEAQLTSYAGTYRSTDGRADVRVSDRDGKLWAELPAEGQSWSFNAQDRTNFYHRGSFLKVRFDLDPSGAAKGFVVQTYDGTSEFLKVRPERPD